MGMDAKGDDVEPKACEPSPWERNGSMPSSFAVESLAHHDRTAEDRLQVLRPMSPSIATWTSPASSGCKWRCGVRRARLCVPDSDRRVRYRATGGFGCGAVTGIARCCGIRRRPIDCRDQTDGGAASVGTVSDSGDRGAIAVGSSSRVGAGRCLSCGRIAACSVRFAGVRIHTRRPIDELLWRQCGPRCRPPYQRTREAGVPRRRRGQRQRTTTRRQLLIRTEACHRTAGRPVDSSRTPAAECPDHQWRRARIQRRRSRHIRLDDQFPCVPQ